MKLRFIPPCILDSHLYRVTNIRCRIGTVISPDDGQDGMKLRFIPPLIPDSHLYRVTNTRCSIGTIFSPDDGHTFARNM